MCASLVFKVLRDAQITLCVYFISLKIVIPILLAINAQILQDG